MGAGWGAGMAQDRTWACLEAVASVTRSSDHRHVQVLIADAIARYGA